MPAELQIFFLSMTPLLELRGAIPFALLFYQMDFFSAYFWAVLGNLVPVFVVILFFDSVSGWLSKKSLLARRFFTFLFQKTRKDHSKRVEKYGYLALALFTAIPLPISGAWTGSLVAVVFGLNKKWSIVAVATGVLIAGVAVTFIVKTGVGVKDMYGAQTLLGVALFIILLYIILRSSFRK